MSPVAVWIVTGVLTFALGVVAGFWLAYRMGKRIRQKWKEV